MYNILQSENLYKQGQKSKKMKTPSKKYTHGWEFFMEDLLAGFTVEELAILNQEYPFVFEKDTTIYKELKNSNDMLDEEPIVSFDINNIEDEQQKNRLFHCCEKNCLGNISAKELYLRRTIISGFDKRELDIYIFSQLITSIIPNNSETKRFRFSYRIDAKNRVCREAFLYINKITISKLKRIQNYISTQDYDIPLHGNTNKTPAHTLSQEAIENVVKFIENYASAQGLPDPGRLERVTREILLPSNNNYLLIWKLYSEGNPKISYNSFRKIWNNSLPYIKFQQCKSDLCDTWEELKNKIQYSKNPESLELIIKQYQEHSRRAKTARQYYKEQIESTKKSWVSLSEDTKEKILKNYSTGNRIKKCKIEPCSNDLSMHYSFDFCQQVFYPYSPQQRGKEYFKSARKCNIFGICSETLQKQVYFLIDESETVGKGAKTVISLLDAFFENYGAGETEINLQADNCTGQNKNNYVIWYLMWRVMTGLNNKITLSFMLPGHTKFSPDGYFGLLKSKYRKSNIDDLQDLVDCTINSSKNNKTIPQVYGKHLGYKKNCYEYKDWPHFLEKYFNPVNGILKYSYFEFYSNKPGKIYLKEMIEAKEFKEEAILKDNLYRFSKDELPSVITPKGLDEERKQYLYKEIRGFVRCPEKQNITCPKPE